MTKLFQISALALIAGLLVWIFWPPSDPPPSLPSPPSQLAPETSLRPKARACAGTVTNNPAILEWRNSQGCPD
ncbi:hypothetical protein AN476_21290 [Phaeobacter sp. 11ANDIMAR09]|nr:hypothetical protein AN476_21290 [Phaeobacter sp. 11ANDIMAR09]